MTVPPEALPTARQGHPVWRHALARRAIPADIAQGLAQDPHDDVLWALARNPRCPAAVLWRLAHNPHVSVGTLQYGVLPHPQATDTVRLACQQALAQRQIPPIPSTE